MENRKLYEEQGPFDGTFQPVAAVEIDYFESLVLSTPHSGEFRCYSWACLLTVRVLSSAPTTLFLMRYARDKVFVGRACGGHPEAG